MAPVEELSEALTRAKAAVDAGECWESAPEATSADASSTHRRPSATGAAPDEAPAAAEAPSSAPEPGAAEAPPTRSSNDVVRVYDGLPLVKEASDLKDKANACFKQKKHQDAAKFYEQGIAVLKRSEGHPMLREEQEQVKALKAVLHSNIAECMLRLQLYRRAIESATACIDIDKENAKAFYRRSQAYEHLQEWQDALRDLLSLKKLGGGGMDPKTLEKRCEELYEKQVAENKVVNEMAKTHEDLFEMKEKFEEVMEKYDLGDGHAAPLVAGWLYEDSDLEQTIAKVAKRWEMSAEEAGHFARWIKKGLDMGVIPKPKQGPLPPK